MSSSRKGSGSRQQRTEETSEAVLECKAAYLAVYDKIGDKITSRDKLVTVLEQSGRNPTTRNMKKYWTDNTDSLSFDDFVDICGKEEVTTTKDLMKAFRKIDINGDGYISLDELYKIMTQRGEKMSRDEVKKIIDEVDENKDGKLDYEEFCNMTTKTTAECNKMSLKMMERKERKKKGRDGGSDGGRSHLSDLPELGLPVGGSMSSVRLKTEQQVGPSERPRRGSASSTTSSRTEYLYQQEDSAVFGSSAILDERDTQTKSGSALYTDKKSELGFIPPTSTHAKEENGMGSQTSLRSGDKETPVPSPRKTVSKTAEDNLPKAPPRSRTLPKSKVAEPKNIQDWNHCSSKGCFFYEDDEIVTHQFKLRVMEDTTVYVTAGPIKQPACLQLPSEEPVDTAIFVVDRSHKLVAFSEHKDARGKYSLKCDLSMGEYMIIPYTTGCRFKQSDPEAVNKEAKLVKKDKEDKVVITSAFRKALEDIFELCDLDGNGTMSKDEFNWFNVRTSGEELGDDEWEVVEERTELVNCEISKDGFIGLNEMEAEDAEGDVEDLWITLNSMGFNKALVMNEVCPYRLDVYVENFRRKPSLKVTGIESLEKSVEQHMCQTVIDATEAVKIRNMKDLFQYTYKSDNRATVVLDNRSRSEVKVFVDCSKSRNLVSNRHRLGQQIEVQPQSTLVAHHLLPKDEDADWSVHCTESILK